MRSAGLAFALLLAAAPAVGDRVSEINPNFERYARGVVERCALESEVFGDELTQLAKVVSVHRQMRHRGRANATLSVETLMPLAEAYANGVEPLLLARRELSRTTVRHLLIGDGIEDGPGTLVERMSIASQMLRAAHDTMQAGDPAAQQKARKLALGGILMIATDNPIVACQFVSLPESHRESIRAAGVDFDALEAWARKYGGSLPSDSKHRTRLTDLADQLARSAQLDKERVMEFSKLLQKSWTAVQQDLGLVLLFCHYTYALRLIAEENGDQESLAILRRLATSLAEESESLLHQTWARQTMTLPSVPRQQVELPFVVRSPHDIPRDPP